MKKSSPLLFFFFLYCDTRRATRDMRRSDMRDGRHATRDGDARRHAAGDTRRRRCDKPCFCDSSTHVANTLVAKPVRRQNATLVACRQTSSRSSQTSSPKRTSLKRRMSLVAKRSSLNAHRQTLVVKKLTGINYLCSMASHQVQIEESWKQLLAEEFEKPLFRKYS